MRAGPRLALPMILLAAVLPAGSAAAACRCTCIQGRSVPQCGPTDMVQSICQNLCTDPVAPQSLQMQIGPRPFGGGGQASESTAAGDQFGQVGQYGR